MELEHRARPLTVASLVGVVGTAHHTHAHDLSESLQNPGVILRHLNRDASVTLVPRRTFVAGCVAAMAYVAFAIEKSRCPCLV